MPRTAVSSRSVPSSTSDITAVAVKALLPLAIAEAGVDRVGDAVGTVRHAVGGGEDRLAVDVDGDDARHPGLARASVESRAECVRVDVCHAAHVTARTIPRQAP